MNRWRIFFLFVLVLFSKSLIAQIDDIGLWASVTLKHKFTQKTAVSLANELRLYNDASNLDQLLTDAGIEYSFTKNLKAELHYRFISKNNDNYFSKRHRVYADVSYKIKIKSLTLTLRERIQEQVRDVNSSELGMIPEWTLRTKLAARLDLHRKYFPYLSGELYYVLDNALDEDEFFSRLRLETGVEYDFNRVHSINPFVLWQHELNGYFTELVYGFGYTYTF
jgi:hypothetical protein